MKQCLVQVCSVTELMICIESRLCVCTYNILSVDVAQTCRIHLPVIVSIVCLTLRWHHILLSACQQSSPPLDNIRVMASVWRLRGNIIRTAPCDTMFTVSSTLMWAVLTGPADWVCHTGTLRCA